MSDTKPLPTLTLENLCGGAALELFQSELDKVLRNIQDPNTDAKAVRKVTLEVIFAPDDEREVGAVSVKASTKLSGLKAAKSQVYFGRHEGRLVATEWNPKQQGLFDEKPNLRAVSNGEKK
jgi:hypothetical protein